MVVLFISAYVKPPNRRELLSSCNIIAEMTSQEKGCNKVRVMLHVDDENRLYIIQRWEGRLAMENYFRSDLFGTLMGAMQVLTKSWEIEIDESRQTEGMETLEAIRSTTI